MITKYWYIMIIHCFIWACPTSLCNEDMKASMIHIKDLHFLKLHPVYHSPDSYPGVAPSSNNPLIVVSVIINDICLVSKCDMDLLTGHHLHDSIVPALNIYDFFVVIHAIFFYTIRLVVRASWQLREDIFVQHYLYM